MPEVREVGLLLGALAVDVSAQAFDLFVVLRVLAAVQCRRPLRPNSSGLVMTKRRHVGQELGGHRRATGRRRRQILGHRAPDAGFRAPDERRQGRIGKASVARPRRDEAGRGCRADGHAGIILRDDVGGEVRVVRRVEKRELAPGTGGPVRRAPPSRRPRTEDPDAPGIEVAYGSYLPSMACTASCMAALTIAQSRTEDGPGRVAGGAASTACEVMSFQ